MFEGKSLWSELSDKKLNFGPDLFVKARHELSLS